MTLWNIIRDFFVEYIFGGTLSNGLLIDTNLIGSDYSNTGSQIYNWWGFFKFTYLNDETGEVLDYYMSLGDWLSTTATIITLCAICFFLFLFVRWLFRLTAGLIQARG